MGGAKEGCWLRLASRATLVLLQTFRHRQISLPGVTSKAFTQLPAPLSLVAAGGGGGTMHFWNGPWALGPLDSLSSHPVGQSTDYYVQLPPSYGGPFPYLTRPASDKALKWSSIVANVTRSWTLTCLTPMTPNWVTTIRRAVAAPLPR